MSDDLFRKEALEAASQRTLGEALDSSRRLLPVIAIFALLLAIAAIFFTIGMRYTRKATVDGVVAPSLGIIVVTAQEDGKVTTVDVAEGSRVEKGQTLFTISRDRQTSAGVSSVTEVINEVAQRIALTERETEDQAQAAASQASHLDARVRLLLTEIESVERSLIAQKRRVEVSRAIAERHRALWDAGFLSELQYQLRLGELAEQEVVLETQQRMRGTAQREVAEARHQISEIAQRLSSQRLVASRTLSSLRQELVEASTRREIRIVSPASGSVAVIAVLQGQTVSASTQLAGVVPHSSSMTAKLLIPSTVAGNARPGTSVRLRYPAFPYERFGFQTGYIESISEGTSSPSDLGNNGRATDPGYVATVRIDNPDQTNAGHSIHLKAGLKVQADLLLESNTMIGIISERIKSVWGRAGA